MENREIFYIVFAVAQVFGLLSFVLTTYGLGHYIGISWEIYYRLGVHPFLMIMGMVYLQGTSLLAFRLLNGTEKIYVKCIHGGLHAVTFIITVIGLQAVFSIKSEHITSFHGLLGLITVILFSAQLMFQSTLTILGAVNSQGLFLDNLKSTLMPYHRIFGVLIFSLSVINSLIGFNSTVINKLDRTLFIFAALFTLLFGIITVVALKRKSFQRENVLDD